MEYSFYGGRPGKSFVIAKDFPTYKDMKTAFAQGWDYQEVGYDEYVLINTTDPRNIENGKLYRRGLEGPVYVGTIQGTPGYPPHLRIEKYGDIQEPVKDDLSTLDYIYSKSEREIESIELVPGKDGDTFNDTIEWKVLSVRAMYYRNKEGKEIANTLDNNVIEDTAARTITFTKDGVTTTGAKYHERTSAEETIVKIGFKFPYHVFDWEAQSIDPYDERYRTDIKNYSFDSYAYYDNLIENMQESPDGKDHPFYSKLNIKVPQGIKGNSIDGLKVVTVSDYKKLKKEEKKDSIAIQHPQWETAYEDIENDKDDLQILVYEFKDYTYNQDGTKITKYLADFDMISNITIDNEGTLIVYFTHRDPKQFPFLIQWVTNTNINRDTGVFTITYNIPADTETASPATGKPRKQESFNLEWVKNVHLQDGILSFTYTQKDGVENAIERYTVQWVTNIDIQQNGTIKYTYNTKNTNGSNVTSTDVKKLKWLSHVELDRQTFHLWGYFNNGTNPEDLGSTKIDSTLSVAFNIDSDNEGVGGVDIGNNLSYLNDTYPNGLNQDVNGDPIGTQWMRGKIVTVGPKVTDDKNGGKQKNFFAYDYNLNQWYYLGSLNRIDIGRVQRIAPYNNYSNMMNELDEGGICFLYRERPSVINEVMEE